MCTRNGLRSSTLLPALAIASVCIAAFVTALDAGALSPYTEHAVVFLGIGTAAAVAMFARHGWAAVVTPFAWSLAFCALVTTTGALRSGPSANTNSRSFIHCLGLLGLVVVAPSLLVIVPFRVARRVRITRQHPPGCCSVCGYDLRGSPGPLCPECGAAFTPTGEEQEDMISRRDAEDAEKTSG